MPTKFAVRTSTLAKTWRYKWTLITNLDFDDSHPFHGLDCFSKFVDKVLGLCKTSKVNLFRLYSSEMWVQKSIVSKWVDQAIRINVRELDIQVIWFEFPISLVTCKTITKLRLIVDRYTLDVLEFPDSIKLPCLNILDISVFHNIPSANAFRLISGCPLLESLSLRVIWRGVEEDYTFNIPTLKRFKLITYKVISVINKVVLNLPNLEYLFLGGRLCSHFVMKDLSSLVEASISYVDIGFNHLMDELLEGISGARAKSLSLRISNYDVPLNTPLLKFPNLKDFELKGSSYCKWLIKIFQILESSAGLEHLCIEEPCSVVEHKPGKSCWIEPQSVPTCMLLKLKTIKLIEFKGQKCSVQFLEYILGHAENLKALTLIVTCKSLCLEEEMHFCRQLLKFPRASRNCEVDFS